MQYLSRLRESFRLPANVSSERCWKARRFFQAAEMALEIENFQEAAANARLAIAFDPSEETYRVGFAAIQSDVHRLRDRALLDRARSVGAQAQARDLEAEERETEARETEARETEARETRSREDA